MTVFSLYITKAQQEAKTPVFIAPNVFTSTPDGQTALVGTNYRSKSLPDLLAQAYLNALVRHWHYILVRKFRTPSRS